MHAGLTEAWRLRRQSLTFIAGAVTISPAISCPVAAAVDAGRGGGIYQAEATDLITEGRGDCMRQWRRRISSHDFGW